MSRARFLMWILLLAVPFAAAQLSIIPALGDSQLGELKTFICRTDGKEGTLKWHRLGEEDEIDDSEHCEITKIDETTSKLTIKSVRREDAGQYQCTAEYDDGSTQKTAITIKVIQSPKFNNVKTSQEFSESENANVICDVEGIPSPAVTWTYGGQDVTQNGDARFSVLSNNHLQIQNIQRSDAGTYTCEAKIKERNEVDSRNISVVVNYWPIIQPPNTETLHTVIGRPVNLTFILNANPAATISVKENGIDIGREGIKEIGREGATSSLYLQVTPASPKDFGTYQINAANKLGTSSKQFIVKEADVPSSPINVTVHSHSTTIEVAFDAPEYNGGIPITQYKVQWKHEDETQWSEKMVDSKETGDIRIPGLNPYTQYEVRVTAVNEKGEGSASSSSRIRTASLSEPDMPELSQILEKEGNGVRINIKQVETGGSEILYYTIRYRAENQSEWGPKKNLTSNDTSVLLSDLESNTNYEVQVTAVNKIGSSQPRIIHFTTGDQAIPDAQAISQKKGVGIGGIVGIIMVIFLVLLIAVDVSCYYTNQCGMLMCLAVNVLGRQPREAKRLEAEQEDITVVRISQSVDKGTSASVPYSVA